LNDAFDHDFTRFLRRAFQSNPRALARRAPRHAALGVSARPRPHHSFHRVPATGIQNPGVRESRGRPVPDSPHHSLEVAQIARTIARLLNLNEDLAEAVALAHDLGHTPFGHAGRTL